jgi:MFS family permease
VTRPGREVWPRPERGRGRRARRDSGRPDERGFDDRPGRGHDDGRAGSRSDGRRQPGRYDHDDRGRPDPYDDRPRGDRYDERDNYDRGRYDERDRGRGRYDERDHDDRDRYDDRGRRYPDDRDRRDDRYDDRHHDAPTKPIGSPPGRQPKVTVTRVAASRTRHLVGSGMRRVGEASRADGAKESGLTSLIWTHTLHYAADAMVTVALAGTVFFSAARSQQRVNVALYLLITMAPFAIVAPFIGPVLDKMQRGRRLALAGTAVGRALLAYIMAANFSNEVALFPAAFGVLVLSKAYGVLRGACVPRVLPPQVSLVTANARLSIFGLAGAAVAGGLLGGFVKITGSYSWGLRITAVVFLVAAVKSLRLPAAVDSAEGEEPVKVLATGTGTGRRRGMWRGQTLSPHVVTALRAAGALRALSGFLTLFLAFLIQETEHGLGAAVAVGGLAAAAGGGSLIGTALGARLRLSRPDPVLLVSIGAVAAISVVAALSYSLSTAILVALVAGVANSFGKLCLDAIIQREVPDSLRASAFARSETMLQLAWVIGGALGIVLPSNGQIGFMVAASLLAVSFVTTVAGGRLSRRLRRSRPPRPATDAAS